VAKHLIDTRPKLSTCNRCESYVLAATACGVRVAVNLEQLPYASMCALVQAGGVAFYNTGRYITRVVASSLTHASAQTRTYLAEHGCGCMAIDSAAFEEAPPTPLRAPVTAAGAVDEGEDSPCSPVPSASPLRSRLRTVRCSECDGIIKEGEPRYQIEVPVWQSNEHTVPNRGTRKGSTKIIEGWGVKRWARHTDGCRAHTSG
jgi:hypothetical protein